MTDDETGSDADLVGLLRHYAEREQDNGLTLAADRLEQMSATIQRVQALHEEYEGECDTCCDGYGNRAQWPCPTVAALPALSDREAGQ